MDSHEEIPELLSLKSVCSKLDLHPNTLRNWERKGLLRSYTIGIKGNRRYRKEDIVRLIKPRYYKELMESYKESERLKNVHKSLEKWREEALKYESYDRF
jgi:DNA-binding transcriptional MerR regulator